MTEFVPRPDHGRRFSHRRLVRLSDAGPDARLRLDGVARYLQDVATDDWAGTGLDPDDTWLVRQTTMRLAPGGRWPELGEEVAVVTWCGGIGPAWAERRSDLEVDGEIVVETVALWVPVDRSGRPQRLRQEFHDVYAEAAGGRRIPGRIHPSSPPDGADSKPWAVRQADLDIIGHANNAAAWAAVTEVADGRVQFATLSHHGALNPEDDVRLVATSGRMWLMVGDDVRLSGEVR
jgi:acyl-ACP thioesterase